MNSDYDYAPPTLRYAHPFTLADLEELDINLVAAEIERLQKSIERLKSTNDQLNEAANEPDLSSHEKQEYHDVVSENDVAMETQKERIGMCVWTLKKRLGIDPKNKHYELDQDTTAITVTKSDIEENQSEQRESAQPQATSGTQNDRDQQEDGVFL